MHSIKQRITMKVSPEALYQALTTEAGLTAWWTKTQTQGDTEGSINSFFFGHENHAVEMQIQSLVPNKLVSWQCIRGPWEEKGLFEFNITPDEKGCVLHFNHQGWPEMDDFYQHCNAKWGFFLVISLKNYLETGTGNPNPEDPDI